MMIEVGQEYIKIMSFRNTGLDASQVNLSTGRREAGSGKRPGNGVIATTLSLARPCSVGREAAENFGGGHKGSSTI